MVWGITVAVFLGTLLAGVLMLFLYSRRNEIREALKAHQQRRVENRTLARVEVELLSMDEPFMNEITLTENISRHGARIVTKMRWRPDDSVTVKLVRRGHRIRARIAYCNPLKGEAFAVGLQFSSPVVSWTV